MTTDKAYEAVVLGVSAGGLHALERVLSQLPLSYRLPLLIVQHRDKSSDLFLSRFLNERCQLHVVEAEEKMEICPGTVYIAPPNYHLQVETNRHLSLAVDGPVNWSRPSVDVLFETAAEVYRDKLVGVVLTGANKDGSRGLARIKQLGGFTVVQDPQTAAAAEMPQSAIDTVVEVDQVLPLEGIGSFLATLNE